MEDMIDWSTMVAGDLEGKTRESFVENWRSVWSWEKRGFRFSFWLAFLRIEPVRRSGLPGSAANFTRRPF